MSVQVSPPKPMNVTVNHEFDKLTAAPRKTITRTSAMYEQKLKPRKLTYDALSPKLEVQEVDVDELFGADDIERPERVITDVAYLENKMQVFLFDDGTYEIHP